MLNLFVKLNPLLGVLLSMLVAVGALVGLYAAFVGLVLLMIMALSDPFQGIGVAPTTFEHVLQTMNETH